MARQGGQALAILTWIIVIVSLLLYVWEACMLGSAVFGGTLF